MARRIFMKKRRFLIALLATFMVFPSASLFAAKGDKGVAKEISKDYNLEKIEVEKKDALTKENEDGIKKLVEKAVLEQLKAKNEKLEEKDKIKVEKVDIKEDKVFVTLSDKSVLIFELDEVLKEKVKEEPKREDKKEEPKKEEKKDEPKKEEPKREDKKEEKSEEEKALEKAQKDAKEFETYVSSSLPDKKDITLDSEKIVNDAIAKYNGLSDQAKKLLDKDAKTKYDEITARYKELVKVEEAKKSSVETAMNDFKKGIRTVDGPHNGYIDVELPTPNVPYFAKVTISGEKEILLENLEVKNLVQRKVRWEGSGKKLTFDINLYDGNKRVANDKVVLYTPKAGAPTLNYAYTFDGGIVINVDAPAGVEKVYWAYKGEREPRLLSSDGGYGTYFSYSDEKNDAWKGIDFGVIFGRKKLELDRYTRLNPNDYRLDIDIPSTINILVVDKNGNQSPFQIKVDKDNVPLSKTVPVEIVNALKDATHFNFKDSDKYRDLIIVDKNTVVDLFGEFKDYIIKNFKKFNTRNLRWTVEKLGEEKSKDIPYTGVHKFTEAGSYIVTVTDTESKSTLQLNVLVNEGRNNVRDYKLDKKEVQVDKDVFKPIDAMKLDLYHNDETANPLQFVAIVNGKYYKLTDEIKFQDKDGKDVSEIKVEIVNLKDNKSFDVVFKKGKTEEQKKDEAAKNTANLSDISGHWAENLIRQMSSRGIITGYEDGTFKPDNRITIKETLAILGRLAKSEGMHVTEKVSDYKIEPNKDKWGYEEVNFAMDRMPQNIFAGRNISGEAITREETAYIISHLFSNILGNSATNISDLSDSKYQNEVVKLVNAGIIKGFPDGTFKPAMDITRAELTSLLFNIK